MSDTEPTGGGTPTTAPRPATPAAGLSGAAAGFVATHWTLVLRAPGSSPAAQAALGELCEAYYAPVHTFIRAAVQDDDAARDLTQEFFARVLAGSALDRVDPERGRFRSFLLGAVKHFLADARDRGSARNRCGGVVFVPLEPSSDTAPGFEVPDPGSLDVDATFDRQWACALLERALQKLGAEMAAEGKAGQYDVLKAWLTGAAPEPQSQAASRLGLNEGAV